MLPVTPDAFQSSYVGDKAYGNDGFITEFNATGSALIYSSYLTGNADDGVAGIAVDAVGDAYVTGSTYSTNFPVTPGAFQLLNASGGGCEYEAVCSDAFVAKFPLGTPSGVSITGLLPNVGGNTGTVTATIVGGGFQSGATASLSCPARPTSWEPTRW